MSGDDGRPSGDRPVDSGNQPVDAGDRSIDDASGRDGTASDGERSVSDDTPGRPTTEDWGEVQRQAGSHDTVTRRQGSNVGRGPSDERRTDRTSEVIGFLRELLTSVAAVVLVGLLLFAISGVWPPMVAVESGSMEPVMHRGDLVFITEPGRYAPDAAYDGTGVVPVEIGSEVGYSSFDGSGSVVVYDRPGSSGSPIIHRAHFWVEDGENWYDRANPDYVSATNCAQLNNCPAPHAGFITKGDANARYDQANGISDPVRPEWITGIAQVRVPYLGLIRLSFGTMLQTGTVDTPVTVDAPAMVEVPGTVGAQTATKNASEITTAKNASQVSGAKNASQVTAPETPSQVAPVATVP